MQTHQGIEQANKNSKEMFLIFSKNPRFQVDFEEADDIFFEGREPDKLIRSRSWTGLLMTTN